SRVETAEGKISSQSGQITSLSNSLDLTNSNLNDVNVLARLLSLGKPLRDDPTFKLGMGGLAPYALQSGSTLTRQAVSADNPTESTYEVLLRATTTLGSGWYPNNPTVLGGPNKAFLVKQVIKMPTGQRVYPYNNPLGTGGFVRMLGNAEGTGKFETYYSIIQCGPDASKSIQGHFRVINSTNPPVPTTSNPVDVILASYEVFDVTAVNDTIPKAYSDAISANANAINSLSNSVTQQGNTITSHSNSITSLNNSITSINSSLTNKADASALNNLSNRVTAAEGNITSQGNSITSLNNTLTNNDLSNLVLNPDFIDPKNGWTSGVIVDATDAAPNPPSLKALKLNNRDSYYGPFVKCNVGDMFYVSAWFATPNTSATASAVLGFNTRNSAGTYTWYSVAIKSTDKNAWGMVEGYFTVPNGMVDIRPWLQVSIAASEAAGQQWHVTNIQVRNITGNKKLATDLQATSSALSTLDSKVTNIDGRVTSASNNIVSLNNSVTNINATLAQKADATALNSLSNRVTNAEGNITSQGNSITSLTNSLAVSGKGGTNLLIKSNVVGLYDGVSYPHHTYKLGEVWEIGAKYTLIWCAEHKRGTGDNNSYLAVYAGGGSQTLQSIVNTDGKVISKVTFVKNSAVASGPIIHFYMINRPTADKGTIGTVYWAVLVKGDVLTTDAWIPSPYDYIPDSNANAAAIANLTNTVSQQGNTITSNSSSITSLNNSITNINSTLATKADSSALTNLASRVTATEGAITSHGSSITSLNASVNGLLKDVSVSDTRSTNQPPSWYWSNYPLRIVREFKQASVLGLTGMGTYVSLETYVYWTDASGGPIIQIARGTDSKLTAERRSASTAAWSTWTQDIKAISDGLANKAEASALSSLDSKVSVIDGKVSTQASSITTLQTTVGGNTASIQSQQQSIDGLKARATLKLQSGNLVGGVGIENDSKTVDFIIQANKFAIGAPSTVSGSVTPKYAFVYQSTATTLPNGTVIPAGLYLDSASISYINANKIYADSLSAISANLGTFTSLADQSKPNGARTVISGERIEVYDENNVMRVRIGRW
ncbi:phage tail protein, partial [Acinetobacter baumannii]|nr:phage tail protein [Acinetobacter baumannii]MDQ9942318.1 phage tail protein [Acinetobacter baumannii]MDR0098227.1 phage tail protein [Acinetobacter baumannii]MDR0100154.1 phage tail protein [Acinetobacter baumannii]